MWQRFLDYEIVGRVSIRVFLIGAVLGWSLGWLAPQVFPYGLMLTVTALPELWWPLWYVGGVAFAGFGALITVGLLVWALRLVPAE